MGQYYKVIIRRNGKDTVYNRDVDGEYTMAKLMEHSWWRNDFCCAFAKTLLDKPTNVCWCGDYAEEDECEELGFDYKKVWGRNKGRGIKSTKFTLSDVKYLINNDKKIYLDLQKYYERCNKKEEYQGQFYDWCIFPISLLTALGNDRGGGDFHEGNEGYSDVGAWAFDEIYVSNTLPEGYKEEIYTFIED